MIDSHCHLDHEPLYQNLNDVILRSKDAGITKLLTICTNLDSFENIKKIINLDPIIYGTFGIHPHDADKNLISKDKIINNSKYSKKIIGIGETGLDFYYNNSDKNNQIKSFINHIEACLDIKKGLMYQPLKIINVFDQSSFTLFSLLANSQAVKKTSSALLCITSNRIFSIVSVGL